MPPSGPYIRHGKPRSLSQSSSHQTRRQFLQTALGTASALTLSSCGWTLANVRSTPRQQEPSDILYLYTWSSYVDPELISEFKAQTGFSVVSSIMSSNEEMLAKIQAGGGGAFSILYPSDYMVAQMIDLELLQTLDRSRIVGLDAVLPQFLNAPSDPKSQHSVAVSWGTTGLVYNPEKLPEPPEDWDYLWKHKDKLTRRVTLLDDPREVMGATLRMLGYSYNSTNPKELEEAFKKLTELKPAIASFTTDAWQPQLLSGDLLIAMAYSPDAINVQQENPNLKYVVPRSGTSLWSDRVVIPKTAPNVDAAYAWINYLLEPSVASQLSSRLAFATPNQAAFEILPPELQNNTDLFPPQATIAQAEGIAPLGDFAEVYDNYWTKLAVS